MHIYFSRCWIPCFGSNGWCRCFCNVPNEKRKTIPTMGNREDDGGHGDNNVVTQRCVYRCSVLLAKRAAYLYSACFAPGWHITCTSSSHRFCVRNVHINFKTNYYARAGVITQLSSRHVAKKGKVFRVGQSLYAQMPQHKAAAAQCAHHRQVWNFHYNLVCDRSSYNITSLQLLG